MAISKAMLDAAIKVMHKAYAPYSNFFVGACFRTNDDILFSGCNIENASYSLTLCAEASALASLVSNGYKQIKEVVIVSSGNTFCPPCGACRQRLYEFAAANTIKIHLYTLTGKQQTISLNELLPYPFNASLLENT